MAVTAGGTPYVESSDLVANYPAVSESLAERVDLVGVLPFADSTARTTALPTPTDGQYSYLQDTNSTEFWNGSAWTAVGTAPGLTLVNTTTFATVTAVNINSVFSATYDNYKIIFERTANTSNSEVTMRLRVGGVDNSGNSYSTGLTQVNMNNGVTAVVNAQGATSWTVGSGQISTTAPSFGTMEIVSPFIARQTKAAITYILYTGNEYYSRTGSVIMDAQTSFDGFSLIASLGTMSGTVRTYGYKNS